MDNVVNDGDVNIPRHHYFWIAQIDNHDTSVIPEYDFDNLKHNHTRDLPLDRVSRFCWYPVNSTIKDRVWEFFHEKLENSVDERIHCININLEEGERLRVHPVWRHDISFLGNNSVTTLYACFKTNKTGEVIGFWVKDDGTVLEGLNYV
jgi:hypothetical protein